MKLTEELDYVAGKVGTKIIAENQSGTSLMKVLDKGTEIPTHKANAIAVVYILEGTCQFTLDGQVLILNQGDYLVMQPNTPHSLYAPERFKMLLTKLNA